MVSSERTCCAQILTLYEDVGNWTCERIKLRLEQYWIIRMRQFIVETFLEITYPVVTIICTA